MSSFLNNVYCEFENRLLLNYLIILRNKGEDQQGCGEGLGGMEDQWGRPDQRWRPKPIRLRFSFGLQKQPALKRTLRSHTESDLAALGMDGKIVSRHFQWNQSRAQIDLESTGIIRGSWCPVSVPELRRRLLVFGPCIVLEPISGASRGSCTTLESS